MTAVILAYLGPGFAAGALQAVLAVFAGLILLLMGSVYYPIKIAIRSLKDRSTKPKILPMAD